MKHNTPSTGKFLKLVRRLRKALGNTGCVSVETIAVGLLERLWHVTMTSTPMGDIGKLDNDEIAELIGWNSDDDELIEILTSTGWLDRSEEHRLVVHDWHEHAPNHIKNNAKRWGKAFASEQNCQNAKEIAKEGAKEDPKEFAKEPPKERPRGRAVPNQTKPNLTQPNQTNNTPPTPSRGEVALEDFSDEQTDDIDWLQAEQEFMSMWNSTEGVVRRQRNVIPRDLLLEFRERWRDPHWRGLYAKALGKFPLQCGVKITLGKFVQESTVEDIIGGKYDFSTRDRTRKHAAGAGQNFDPAATAEVPTVGGF